MRLICPNCGAQYEVADDVIPEAGRDVQCSNCGHTWFENRGASEAAELGAPVPTPDPQPEPEVTQPEPRQRELSPDVADILRQEADFEQAARQADDNTIETQPDLDLSHDPEPHVEIDPDEDRRGREARDAPRRELLPDIEEVNSSLRPDAAQTAEQIDDDLPQKRGRFRRGFMIIVILALIALAAYIFAPQISAAVPQLEPVLTSYVNWVNEMRIWLDQQLQGLIASETAGTPEN
ncbi:zinc-ribbon domain-containing protein [Octadecabacter sp.]|nr:zinc-ribbon domain-containing protein [Octadecabacter sp.]